MNGNGNGDGHDVEIYEDDSDYRAQAIMLTESTLSAIGGLEKDDPDQAAEVVARVYLRMLRAVREEE